MNWNYVSQWQVPPVSSIVIILCIPYQSLSMWGKRSEEGNYFSSSLICSTGILELGASVSVFPRIAGVVLLYQSGLPPTTSQAPWWLKGYCCESRLLLCLRLYLISATASPGNNWKEERWSWVSEREGVSGSLLQIWASPTKPHWVSQHFFSISALPLLRDLS